MKVSANASSACASSPFARRWARLDAHGKHADAVTEGRGLAEGDVDGLEPGARVAARKRKLAECDLAAGVPVGERGEQLIRRQRGRRPDEPDLQDPARGPRQ
jgi:hypothetical protein